MLKLHSLHVVGLDVTGDDCFVIVNVYILSTSGAVTAYVSHLGQILPKSQLLSHETLGAPNL